MSASDNEECRRRNVSGNVELLSLQARAAADGDGALVPADVRAHLLECNLGVVASGKFLHHLRFTLGEQSGEQDGGLHLRAGDGHFIADRS